MWPSLAGCDGRGGGGAAVAGRRRAADAGTFVAHSGQSNDGLALAYHHLVGLSGIHEFRIKLSVFFAAYAVGQALGRVVPLDDVLEGDPRRLVGRCRLGVNQASKARHARKIRHGGSRQPQSHLQQIKYCSRRDLNP